MDRTDTNSNKAMYTDVLGRTFASQSTTYNLPADAPEHNRLNIQHEMLKNAVGGLYVPPDLVKKALDPKRPDPKCAVMDVGTGSGIWALEMAKEFPFADVVGMDLVDPLGVDAIPPNCRFEIGDANLDLGHYAEAFDVVHARSVGSGITDFKATLHKIAQMLRPQGILLLVSPGPWIFSETREALVDRQEGEPGWSAMRALNDATRLAIERGGNSTAATIHWREWLTDLPLYTNVGESDVWIPMGPWKEGMNEPERAAAELLRQNALAVILAFKPRLVEAGHDEAVIDRWILTAQKELHAMEPRLYMRWKFAWATRTPDPWTPL